MRMTCPACGAMASLDVLIGHQGARDAVLAALKLPAPIGDLLIQYVSLFRPQQRQLSFDKLARLLNELLPMISAAKVERNGRMWAAPLESWRSAFEEMLAKRDKLTLPIKSHGYLLEVIAGYANKGEAKAETKQEQKRAYPYSQAHVVVETPRASREAMESGLEKIKGIVKGGKRHEAN